MLITFNRLKRILPIVILIMATIVIVSYRDSFKSMIWSKLPFFSEVGDVEDLCSSENAIVTVTAEGREINVCAEIADTVDERTQGLMNRESLCENCGMLFVFDADTSNGFWMKNCEIPLDILFVDANLNIVDVRANFEPCDPALVEVCPSYSPEIPYRYALEVNGGWAEKNGVTVGGIMEIM